MVESGSNEVMEEAEVRDIILYLQECYASNFDWESERGLIDSHGLHPLIGQMIVRRAIRLKASVR